MSNHKELVKDLISSFKNEPEKWEFDEHYATHVRGRVKFWTANGWLGLHTKGKFDIGLSLLEKIKIYEAMSECRAAHISAAIRKDPGIIMEYHKLE